jgi:triacylglycerol lipase
MGVLPVPIPAVPRIPPLWREARIGLEAAALLRSPVYRGAGVQSGDGRPVMLIPGFMAGDGTLATMTHWLRANGYRTRRAGMRMNVGCSEEACARLEQRLERFADATGAPVTIIGQSRGGLFAKALATRRPDLVRGIVTLGAPTLAQLRVHPVVLAQVVVVGALGTGRVPGMFSIRCLRGDCCERFHAALRGPFPAAVGYTSVYSRSDGIVDWRTCLDPDADEHAEIRASHCGMAVIAAAYERVALALAA